MLANTMHSGAHWVHRKAPIFCNVPQNTGKHYAIWSVLCSSENPNCFIMCYKMLANTMHPGARWVHRKTICFCNVPQNTGKHDAIWSVLCSSEKPNVL